MKVVGLVVEIGDVLGEELVGTTLGAALTNLLGETLGDILRVDTKQ